ncbi:hypothetical protein L226DRAFT_530267 [Lentinus tigrinus ALCF2SS1-7]|uniref:uncharacterized protein n=1 Tax=Lentinus tigrinus ALCF2SS1-7 TaxID=1328758 RepID=UPI001165CD94|nr:hypothetical protein L226DRAFT_530267 [Lentinus tigrinus ALCF2SS1-7]
MMANSLRTSSSNYDARTGAPGDLTPFVASRLSMLGRPTRRCKSSASRVASPSRKTGRWRTVLLSLLHLSAVFGVGVQRSLHVYRRAMWPDPGEPVTERPFLHGQALTSVLVHLSNKHGERDLRAHCREHWWQQVVLGVHDYREDVASVRRRGREGRSGSGG